MLPPVIVSHPVDTAVPPGGTLVFMVVANGENLVYQWYQAVGGGDMALTDIPESLFGSDSDTLIFNDVTEAEHEGAMYYVIISNNAGNVTSNTATATVGKFSSNIKLCHVTFSHVLCHHRRPSSHRDTTS